MGTGAYLPTPPGCWLPRQRHRPCPCPTVKRHSHFADAMAAVEGDAAQALVAPRFYLRAILHAGNEGAHVEAADGRRLAHRRAWLDETGAGVGNALARAPLVSRISRISGRFCGKATSSRSPFSNGKVMEALSADRRARRSCQTCLSSTLVSAVSPPLRSSLTSFLM